MQTKRSLAQCLVREPRRCITLEFPSRRRRRFSRVAKYLVLAGVVAAVLWVVCNVVVVRG
jgi:hypothetical protein